MRTHARAISLHMITIVFVNGKGGVGKTTGCLAMALAAQADGRHGPVVVVDLDQQLTAFNHLQKNKTGLVPMTKLPSKGGLVFVDTPGLDLQMTRQAITNANLVVIPTEATTFSLRGSLTAALIAEKSRRPVCWLPSRVRRTKASEMIGDNLRDLMAPRGLTWPVLPGLPELVGCHNYLTGEPEEKFAQHILANWTVVKGLLTL